MRDEDKGVTISPHTGGASADIREVLKNEVEQMDDGDLYLVHVLLLCSECRGPIKAWINSEQWIRVELIGPYGECRKCIQLKKAALRERTA